MMPESSVSGSYANALLDFLQVRGAPARDIRRVFAADIDNLDVPTRRVQRGELDRLLHWWRSESGDHRLGLEFGRAVGGAGFGVLGVAAASGATLADSIRALGRLEPITSTLGTAQVRVDASTLRLGWCESTPPSDTSSIYVETMLASWVSFGRFLISERAPILRIELAHPAHSSLSEYEDAFQAPVVFSAKESAIVISRDLLEGRSRFAHAGLHNNLDQWANDDSLFTALQQSSFLSMVIDAIEAGYRDGAVNELDTAARLGVSRRSLQRHLAAAGSSFRQLLERARTMTAISELLRLESSTLDVSARIGFAEQTSFCRSFRRATGMSPGQFRRWFPPHYAQTLEQSRQGRSGDAPRDALNKFTC